MNSTLVVWLQLTGLLAVEVAVIVGIAAQLQRLTGSAAWRRTIWQACVLGLLLLVIFEFTGTARGFFAWTGRTPASGIGSANLRISTKLSGQPPQLQTDFQAASGMRESGDPQPVPLPGARETIIKPGAGSSDVPAASGAKAKKLSGVPAASESLSVLWLALVWLAGAALVIGRALVCRVVLEVIRRKRGGLDNIQLRTTVQTLAQRLGIRRRVRLMESAHICSPAAFGILRPTIGLPPQFGVKFNSVQREAMLAHELAHLAGNDPAWYLLADVLAAALWWHPLIWWSRRQLHAQSELAADEASLLVADGPGVLAECLVELGARLARTRSLVPLGVAGNGFKSGLGRRVEQLVKLEGAVWRPPNRIRCGLAGTLGAVGLVTAAILCTAWVVPPALTKGENMQTMKQTWKKSLAAFALLTAFSPDRNPALADTTESSPAAGSGYFVTTSEGFKPAGQSSGASWASATSSEQLGDSVTRFSQLTMSKQQQAIEEKLERITLNSVKYDGLPLMEVINNLIETCAKQDPHGVNFVLNREVSAPGPVPIDPATGLPAAKAVEAVDLGSVAIKVNPAIKNIRLIDVLDVITKTAEQPIHYTIEDYGVLFSLGAAKKEEPRRVMFQDRLEKVVKKTADTSALEVMTFKVDTNTFFVNLERTFGAKLPNNSAAQIRATLQDVFQRSFGINLGGQDKTLFYNDATGIIMVRGTAQDVATMKGAIEMLGGTPYLESGAISNLRVGGYEAVIRNSGSGGGGASAGGGFGGVAKPPGDH